MPVRPSDFLVSEDANDERKDTGEYNEGWLTFYQGFSTGVAAYYVEWLLPAWPVAIRLALDILGLLQPVNYALGLCGIGSWQRYTIVCCLAFTLIAATYTIPEGWRFFLYHSVVSVCLIGMGKPALAYLEQLEPGRRHALDLVASSCRLSGRLLAATVLLSWRTVIQALNRQDSTNIVYALTTCTSVCVGTVYYLRRYHEMHLWRYTFFPETLKDLACQLDSAIHWSLWSNQLNAIKSANFRQNTRGCTDYSYEQLPPDHIRLLVLDRIHPIRRGPLNAQLISMPFSSAPPYEALSYCWGSGAMIEELYIDGQRLKITKSAFEFLVYYSSVFQRQCLWIDAICIDQQNNAEKGEQVMQMPRIYSRATRTIAYLRDDREARCTAAVLFECLSFAQLGNWLPNYLISVVGRGQRTRWRSLSWLLRNPYFRRAWIVQEVALSTKLVFSIGGRLVSSDVVYNALADLACYEYSSMLVNLDLDLSKQSRVYCSASTDALRSFALRPDTDAPYGPLELGERARFASILFELASSEASDIRDHVYAALGPARDLQPDVLKPDYTKTSATVLQEATVHVLVRQPRPSLHILAHAGVGFSGRSDSRPSWVMRPDDPGQPLRPLTYVYGSSSAYKAGTGNVADVSLHADILRVRGVLCDTLLCKSDACLPGMTRAERQDIQDVADFSRSKLMYFLAARQLLKQNIDSPDSEPVLIRMAYALTADPQDMSEDAPTDADIWRSTSLLRYFAKIRETLTGELQLDRVLEKGSRALPSTDSHPESINIPVLGMYEFAPRFLAGCGGRSFALTKAGRFALVPLRCQAGDRVFVPFGAQTPFLVRPVQGEPQRYELMGEAYVQGLMSGEALRDNKEGEMIALI